jgi:hypothetical protein
VASLREQVLAFGVMPVGNVRSMLPGEGAKAGTVTVKV